MRAERTDVGSKYPAKGGTESADGGSESQRLVANRATRATSGKCRWTRSSTPCQRPSRKLQLPGELAAMDQAARIAEQFRPAVASAGARCGRCSVAASTSAQACWTASPRTRYPINRRQTRQTWNELRLQTPRAEAIAGTGGF